MTGTISASDRVHLARALAIAERGRRRTSPNPAVGCVLVRDGRRVAEGVTEPAGGPHAEVVACKSAGGDAAGATAYVTLEPCAHHGRTPPCTDALRAAGIVRVVYGHPDPNPVARGGAAALRAEGLAVCQDPVVAPWVACQLEGFLTVAVQRRPHVTLKLAQGVDGRLTAARRWLTGPRARAAVHRWRAVVDAVLVGSGTVVTDDPRLDVRDVAAPNGQPRAVVLDARLRTPPHARVARPGTLVVTTPDHPAAVRRALTDQGVEVVPVAAGDAGGVDLPAAFAALADRGITSVLAEPGPTLAAALTRAGLVDRLVLHVALDLGDGPVVPAVAAPPGQRWAIERSGGAGADLVLHYRPTPAKE